MKTEFAQFPVPAAQTWNFQHRNDIQGLRAIAVAAVVCFHAGLPIPGGFTGVDVFFVISGFVIALLLSRQWERQGRIDLWGFYFRRFKRLTPALSLLVSVTMIMGVFFLSPTGMQAQVSAKTGMSAVLMTANIVIALMTGGYFNLASANNPFLNIWSLSVEEQFYLFFPAVLIGSFMLARRGRVRAPLIIIGLLAVLSLTAAVAGSSSIDIPQKMRIFLGFYSPVSRAWEFAAGAILALLRDKAPRTPLVVNLLAVMGCILLFASFFFITGDVPFPGLVTLLPVVGTVFLILAGSSRGHISPVSRVLATSPLVRVGDMSYSWYLWHWPVIVFTSKVISHQPAILAAAAVLSLIPAAASYRWLENPLRHYTPSKRTQNGSVTLGFASKFIACTIIPSLAICGFYMIANSQGYWSGRIRAYQEIVDPLHVAHRAGCGDGFVPPVGGTACLWNADKHGVPIYVIGDSNADHLSEAVIAAGQQLGSPVRIVSKGGCGLVGGAWSNQSAAADTECQKFVRNTLALIARSRPGIVIIGMSDSNWWIDGVQVGPSREHMLSDPAQILRYLDGSLVDISRAIRTRGHKLLLVQPVPKYVTRDNKLLFDPDQCTIISVLAGRCPQRISVSTAFEDNRQGAARTAIAAAAKASGSDLLDLRPAFCFHGRCSVWGKNGELWYRDAGHLSVEGSEALSGMFLQKLKAMQAGMGPQVGAASK